MPVHTAKRGSSYVVTDAKGKIFGTHKTKKKAQGQASKINMELKRKGKI